MSNLMAPPIKPSMYNKVVEDVFPGPQKYMGEVGIEIEMEGKGLPLKIPSYWDFHREPSLRGEEAAEYVLKKPVKRASVRNFVAYLDKYLKKVGAKIDQNQRTSVHVHINTQGMVLREVYNYICLYILFEDLLGEYAGETRIGNLFCLRAKDAEYLITVLRKIFKKDLVAIVGADDHRYAAVNICALPKYNSLEFRSLRGTTDPDIITNWVNLLLALKDAAMLYKFPSEIVQDFSRMGGEELLCRVFPRLLRRHLRLDRDLHEFLKPSMRLIQDLAFTVDWKLPDRPVRKRLFGRQSKPIEADDPRIEREDDDVGLQPGI